MVSGSIQKQHSIFLPARPISIQLFCKLCQVHLHDRAVRVDLCEREVDITFCIYGGNQRIAWLDLFVRNRIGGPMLPPFLPGEGQAVDRGLIHIQDSFLTVEQL